MYIDGSGRGNDFPTSSLLVGISSDGDLFIRRTTLTDNGFVNFDTQEFVESVVANLESSHKVLINSPYAKRGAAVKIEG